MKQKAFCTYKRCRGKDLEVERREAFEKCAVEVVERLSKGDPVESHMIVAYGVKPKAGAAARYSVEDIPGGSGKTEFNPYVFKENPEDDMEIIVTTLGDQT